MRTAVLFLILFGAGTPIKELRAQAIIAPSGRTLFSGATLIRSFARIDRFSLETAGASIDSTRYVAPLVLVHGVYPRWSVIAALPYVTVDATRRMNGKTEAFGANGLADSQFFLQYDGLYSRNSPGGLTRLAGVFGVRAPTGADRFSTGAFEYTAGLVFTRQARLKYVFTADFEYTLATTSSRGVSAGDRASFDAVPGYFLISSEKAPPEAGWLRRLYDRLFRNGAYLLLELNGSWQGRAHRQGQEVADSGGTMLTISPGIQYFPSQNLMLEFSAPIPVLKELHSVQPEPKTAFVVGLRYLL